MSSLDLEGFRKVYGSNRTMKARKSNRQSLQTEAIVRVMHVKRELNRTAGHFNPFYGDEIAGKVIGKFPRGDRRLFA